MIPATNTPLNRRRKSIISNASKDRLQQKPAKNTFKLNETELGFHYEIKIPGYIKDDFRFYISGNNLVITTDKSKTTPATEGTHKKHNYCYPSALFKMNIALPKKPIKKKITVEYRNEILYFSLFKLD
ncbi:hypothetical protein [Seonamhaeicola sp.]|uniref:hypothetical protein n=1 Tax=Seonamhaeicola sp. TaxID=1912245 RepID=UPI002632E8F9|nr:hypothetical protein [Seonamhaeicola sp.]